jgi:hypothetical protein
MQNFMLTDSSSDPQQHLVPPDGKNIIRLDPESVVVKDDHAGDSLIVKIGGARHASGKIMRGITDYRGRNMF